MRFQAAELQFCLAKGPYAKCATKVPLGGSVIVVLARKVDLYNTVKYTIICYAFITTIH